MSGRTSKILKSSFGVAVATLLSRFLGLVRVRLEASVLGGGELASGWFLAFAIANLMRRLFGEGAVGQALIPIVADTHSNSGVERVRRELFPVFAVLGLILGLLVVLVSGGVIAIASAAQAWNWKFFLAPHVQLALQILPLLMPYGLFMCLVGVITGVLNYFRKFFLPALGSLLLNIFLISGLGYFLYHPGKPMLEQLQTLSVLTLLSGLVQLSLMLILLLWCGVFPKISWDFSGHKAVLKKLYSLALPGIIGGAALQTSFLIDRLLAAYLGPQAVPALTYVDRLVDLPIGMFALALGQVLMTSLSRSSAAGDMESFRSDLEFSLRQVMFLCIPMALAVVFFQRELLSVLCLGGRYTQQDLESTSLVACFYGLGIPFFCALKVLVPGFYARKMMNIPLYASLTAIGLNLALNLSLMWHLRQGGLALATLVSSMAHVGILLTVLHRQQLALNWGKLIFCAGRCTAAAIAAVLVSFGSLKIPVGDSWTGNLWRLGILLTVFPVVYFGVSAVIRCPELGEIIDGLRRKRS